MYQKLRKSDRDHQCIHLYIALVLQLLNVKFFFTSFKRLVVAPDFPPGIRLKRKRKPEYGDVLASWVNPHKACGCCYTLSTRFSCSVTVLWSRLTQVTCNMSPAFQITIIDTSKQWAGTEEAISLANIKT